MTVERCFTVVTLVPASGPRSFDTVGTCGPEPPPPVVAPRGTATGPGPGGEFVLPNMIGNGTGGSVWTMSTLVESASVFSRGVSLEFVSVIAMLMVYVPSAPYVCEPLTSNGVPSATTWPVVVVPSPQLMVAWKFEARPAGLPS